MALCIAIQATQASGPPSAISSPDLYTQLPWSVATAVKTGEEWSCPTGTHLLMTVAEVNEKPPIPIDAADVAAAYAWGISAVMVLWGVGWVVGLIVNTIRKA